MQDTAARVHVRKHVTQFILSLERHGDQSQREKKQGRSVSVAPKQGRSCWERRRRPPTTPRGDGLLERNAASAPLRICIGEARRVRLRPASLEPSTCCSSDGGDQPQNGSTQEQQHGNPTRQTHGQGRYRFPRTQIWSSSCALLTLFTLDTYTGENKTEKKKKKTTTKNINMPFLHSKAILCISVGCMYQMLNSTCLVLGIANTEGKSHFNKKIQLSIFM